MRVLLTLGITLLSMGYFGSNESLEAKERSSEVVETVIERKVVDNVVYETREAIVLASATTQSVSGNVSASGQDYGVASATVVNYTLSWPENNILDLSIKFNQISAKYTYLPSQTASVTKIEYSVRLEPPYGTSDYFKAYSTNNPSAGVSYTKILNSGKYKLGADNVIVMMTVYFSNGKSSTYIGNLV